jgi:hypothetical protein
VGAPTQLGPFETTNLTVCFLEYQMMDKVQKVSSPDCNTPASEPFRIDMRFQVPTVTSMKMAVFWVVTPCSLVEVYL